jgi:predicted phage terminase large subunit-like protein
VAKGGARIAIETPPRHGKSFYVSRALPAWFLGNQPDKRVAVACGAQSLARKWGRMARNDFDAHGQTVFGLTVDRELSAADDWGVTGHEGGMRSYGVGSQFSGDGADLLCLDDLILDAEQAMSETQRENVWDWLESVAFVRLEPRASVVSIQTRWHEDDPHGRIRDRLRHEGWTVIRLPALAEDHDPLGRQRGEALCPERYDVARLEAIRLGKSPYWWSSLFQQRPSPESGGLWKREWWESRRFTVDGDMVDLDGQRIPLASCWRFLTVDQAKSTRTSADYTVIAAWALTPERTRRLCLLDLDRRRLEAPDVNPAIRAMLARWKAGAAYIEDEGTAGTVQYARREGIPVRTVSRKTDADLRLAGDKVLVAQEATPWAANGGLWVPRSAPWLADWEGEMLSFPNGAHDDMEDVTAWACHLARALPAWGASIWSASAATKPASDPWTAQDDEDDRQAELARRGSTRAFLRGMGPGR